MRAEFSEFSYGYAVIREYEIRLSTHLKVAPFLPSLRFEKYVGYDVRVVANKNIFLQFKIPEYLEDRRAKEWMRIKQPYYRFKLDNPLQLYTLISLSQMSAHNIVRYVAPVFYRLGELDNYFKSHSIFSNSVFIPPDQIVGKNIRSLGSTEHAIVYFSNNEFFVFSEPRRINLKDEDLDIIKSFKKELQFIHLSEYILNMRKMTLDLIDHLLREYFIFPDKKEVHTNNTYLHKQLEERYKFITSIEGELKSYKDITEEVNSIKNIFHMLSQFYSLFLGIIPYFIINEKLILNREMEAVENA